jgi:hypothetical protein
MLPEPNTVSQLLQLVCVRTLPSTSSLHPACKAALRAPCLLILMSAAAPNSLGRTSFSQLVETKS